MLIIGADYHPSFQQVAFCSQDTGECGERRLNHSDGEAERFYRDLKQQGISVRVGMEATGYSPLRDFHVLAMTKRNTYKGRMAKMPEIVTSRNLTRKAFIYLPPAVKLKQSQSVALTNLYRSAAQKLGDGIFFWLVAMPVLGLSHILSLQNHKPPDIIPVFRW